MNERHILVVSLWLKNNDISAFEAFERQRQWLSLTSVLSAPFVSQAPNMKVTLVQASVLSLAIGEEPRLLMTKPRFLLAVAWIAFVVGTVALFVFAWATTFGGAALGF